MLLSYIKSAYRSILANKLFSAIHITGLSIGLAACFIMLMIVIHEYSYDKHNEKLDRIYRAYSYASVADKNWYGVPLPLAGYIKDNIPEAENAAKAFRIRTSVTHINDEEVFDSKFAYCADKELLDILTIKGISGDLKAALSDPEKMLISRSIAEKYFKNENPIGKYLLVKCMYPLEEKSFAIAGVFEDLPYTSTFKSDFLLPFKFAEGLLLNTYSYRKDFSLESWSFVNRLDLFVLRKNTSNAYSIETKLPTYEKVDPANSTGFSYKLQPYSEAHLNSRFVNISPYYIDISKVKLFTGIAVLILFIACLNFIVMSTSRLNYKAKDVGIRKVIGASKINVFFTVLMESVFYALLSFPVTFGFIELSNGFITDSLNLTLANGYSSNFEILFLCLLLTIVIGVISGLYSVTKLTRLTPLQTITYKKISNEKKLKSTPVFLAVQMVVFISLIFCALIVKQQTSYFKEIDLGFNPSNMMVLDIYKIPAHSYESFKEELKKSPVIENVSGAVNIPPTLSSARGNVARKDDPSSFVEVWSFSADYDFINTMELSLLEGRQFQRNHGLDSSGAYILNETAMKSLNFELGDMIGQSQIIGVVKDFKYGSIREKVPPIMLTIGKTKYLRELAIRYEPGRDYEAIKWIKEVWGKFVPDRQINYGFLDENFDQVYKNEYNFAGLINASAGLAIFIACLGLFGFTVFSTEQRIKEIGIRRVLGASLIDILRLFFSQFVLLIIVSSVIGIALGDYFISQWLNGFAYKIDILPSYYIIAGVISAVIILSTISIYIIKTVSSNPVESLKYE